MEDKDLPACDAPPAQDGTKTLASPGTSDVLRRFDQDTTLVTSVALSFLVVAAAVLACQLVQTESVRQTVADTVRATDQPQETQLTSSTPPEALSLPVETPISDPGSPGTPSSQSNPIETQIATGQLSLEPVEELAEPKSKPIRHRTSVHHKVVDVKTRLLMLWHEVENKRAAGTHSGKALPSGIRIAGRV
jgi:hypothetical protein